MANHTAHPSREARVHILGALLGVSMAFAIERTINDGWGHLPQVIALPAFVITAVVFTVAMMQMSQNESYTNLLTERANLWRAVFDMFSDVLTAVLLAVMAFQLDNAWGLFVTNVAFRLTDLSVEACVVKPVMKDEFTKTWLQVDLIALGALLITGFGIWRLQAWESSAAALAMSIVFLLFTLIDTYLDLTRHAAFYFDTKPAQ